MARKRYQRGTVFLRGKNPVWVGRYREDVFVGNEEKPRRVLKSVVLGTKKELPTKRLAERKLEPFLFPINSVTYRPTRIATVKDFAETWKTQVLSKRKASTIHAAESHLKNQIIPRLGQLRLDEVGAEIQQRFVNGIAESLSRKTVLNVVGTLSSMMKTAKNWGYTSETVILSRLVFPEREVREKARSLTIEQMQKIIVLLTGQFKIMFMIAAMMGLRAGEILGLKAEDFDFNEGLLTIRRTAWRGKVQTPKTQNSEAVLPVPQDLLTTIKAFLNGRGGFLFVNRRGHLFIAENVVRQALTPILDKLKIPRCGFHAFRHAHTSLLFSKEVAAPPTVAQRQLRHSDARTTLQVYGHVVGAQHREAVEKVATVLNLNAPKLEQATV